MNRWYIFVCFVPILCMLAGSFGNDDGQAARAERPAWVPQAWVMTVPRTGGHVEARVWFDTDEQSYQWTVLRGGGNRPDGYQWYTGACKTERAAKRAAEAAIEELNR